MTVESSNRPAARSRPAPGGPGTAGAAGPMITVAPTGAELDQSGVPPMAETLEELVTTAMECRKLARRCSSSGLRPWRVWLSDPR
jgi:hypothetical protein